MVMSSGSEALLAWAALTSGGINASPWQQQENCCLLFCKGAWRDELPEAAPEACDEAGSASQSS